MSLSRWLRQPSNANHRRRRGGSTILRDGGRPRLRLIGIRAKRNRLIGDRIPMAKFDPLKKTHVPKIRMKVPQASRWARGKKTSAMTIAKRGY